MHGQQNIKKKIFVRKTSVSTTWKDKFKKKNHISNVVVAEIHTALHESVEVVMLMLAALHLYKSCMYSASLYMVQTHCSIYIL